MFIFGFIVGFLVAMKIGAKSSYKKAFKNARIEFKDTLKREKEVQRAFEESIERAREIGVPEDRIIYSIEEGDRYFTE